MVREGSRRRPHQRSWPPEQDARARDSAPIRHRVAGALRATPITPSQPSLTRCQQLRGAAFVGGGTSAVLLTKGQCQWPSPSNIHHAKRSTSRRAVSRAGDSISSAGSASVRSMRGSSSSRTPISTTPVRSFQPDARSTSLSRSPCSRHTRAAQRSSARVLVPAAMQLLGDHNWYLPSRLQWLPHFDVDGHVEEAASGAGRPAPTDARPRVAGD
jgi:hypothetical protein